MPRYNNYAYIDGVNLHLTYENLDWGLDYKKLLHYLQNKHGVVTAHYFLGNTPKTKPIYDNLSAYGYNIKLKEASLIKMDEKRCPKCGCIIEKPENRYKADVDSLLSLQVISDLQNFDKAVIITSDGDYDELVKKLIRQDKLKLVFAPCKDGCSKLLKRAAIDKIAFMNEYRQDLEKN